MTASSHFGRVKYSTNASGTSNLSVDGTERSSQVGDGITPAEAGIANSTLVSYYVVDGNNWAYGQGTYSTTGPTITRATNEKQWNGSTYSATGKLSLSGGGATVFLGMHPDEIVPFELDQLQLQNGADAKPSYSFGSDDDTGIYSPGADQLGLVAGGVELLRLVESTTDYIETYAPLRVYGNVSWPSITFASDSNVGMGNPAAGQLSLYAASQNERLRLTANDVEVTSVPLRAYAGVGVSAPGIAFSTDTDSGLHLFAGDQLQIVAGGVAMVRFVEGVNDYIYPFVPIWAQNGSASLPTYGFVGDTDTGLYLVAGDKIGLTAGGTLRLALDSTGAEFTVPVHAHGGSSLSAPGISFDADTDSGFYRNTADQFSLVAGGVELLRFVENTDDYVQSLVPLRNITGTNSVPAYSFSGATGTGMNGNSGLIWFCLSGTPYFGIYTDRIWISGSHTPASASATGQQGDIAWDSNYIYVCTATDTWKRAAIATW